MDDARVVLNVRDVEKQINGMRFKKCSDYDLEQKKAHIF